MHINGQWCLLPTSNVVKNTFSLLTATPHVYSIGISQKTVVLRLITTDVSGSSQKDFKVAVGCSEKSLSKYLAW